MGPIKIKIATTQIEGASEYDVPKEPAKASSEYDAPAATPSSTPSATGEQGSCYETVEGETVYTEPASGARYTWDVERSAWVNKKTGEARAAGGGAAPQHNYKYDSEGYFYVDRLTMVRHRWSQEDGVWKEAGKVEDDEEEESEEEENMTAEEVKARQYRKRKAAPWFQPQQDKKIEKVRRMDFVLLLDSA